MRTVTTYDRVTYTAVVPTRCGCGRRGRVQKTFGQTVNPFNKNPDGSVKTKAQVLRSVTAQAEEWAGNQVSWMCPRHRRSE